MDHSNFLARIRSFANAVSPLFEKPLSPREAWQEVRAINELFKEVRFPTKEEKDDARGKFQQIVEVLKRRQEERAQESAELRDQIIDLAKEATPLTAGGSGLVMAFVPFSAVADAITDDPLRGELTECRAALDKGYELLNSPKANMLREHKDEAYRALKSAGDELKDRWEKWTEWRREQQSTKYRQKVEKEIVELEEKIRYLTTKCGKAAESLAKNHERLGSTRNSAKREEIEQWISDCEDNLESMREKIKSWQDSIAKKQEKLDRL